MSKPENNTDCTALTVVVIFRYFWFKSLLISFEPSDACTFAFLRCVLLTITNAARDTVFVHQFPLLQSSPKSR